MKRLWVFLICCTVKASSLQAQNEFAAKAFYNAVTDYCADGLHGFENCRGPKLPEREGVYTDEYALKTILPLSDSGKLVWPMNKRPYLLFYMEGSADQRIIEERSLHLREALGLAMKKSYVVRTETVTDKNKFRSDSYLFEIKNQANPTEADFRIGFYQKEGRFYLELEIRGNRMTENP